MSDLMIVFWLAFARGMVSGALFGIGITWVICTAHDWPAPRRDE